MADLCRNVDGVYVPGCIGGAVYGRWACTCDRAAHRKTLEQRIEALERRIKKLEKPTPTPEAARAE